MLWRQIIRVAALRAALNKRSGILKLNERYINYARLTNINSSHLSTWNDGISRADPLQKEGPAKGTTGKTELGPKITLIGTDESISVVALEEGQKLAKRRNLRLVKMVDFETKTQRPVYRLMSTFEFNEEYKKEKASKAKSQTREKLVTFSSRISANDMHRKVKMMAKWLAKEYEVRVVITGDANDNNAAEVIYKALEDHLKEISRFLQKRQVNANIRFTVQKLPGIKSSAVQEKKDQKLPSAGS